MKKTLLATAVSIITISSSCIAADKFYVKTQVGLSKFNNFKVNEINLKSKNTGFFGMAVGCYPVDKVRIEFGLDHFFKPTFKSNKAGGGFYNKSEIKVNTLMLNSFFNLYDMDMVKLFVGAGLGVSKVQTKYITADTTSTNANKITNMSFAGYIGAEYEIVKGVNAELTYSYRYIGKNEKEGNVKLKSNNISAGIRFNI